VAEDKSKVSHKRRAALSEDDEWPPLPDGWPAFTRPLIRPRSGTPIDFDPGKWTPIQDGFTRIRAVVGERTAVRDLQEDLHSGRLKMARRWISYRDGARWSDPPDGEMLCEQLKPSFWEGGRRAYTRPWPNDWTQIEVLDIGQDASSLYYIFRADLERRYPFLEEASPAPAPPSAAELEQETPRLPSWVTVHSWGMIYAEIARRCLDSSGRLAIPQQRLLVTDMTAWCHDRFGFAPHERELREAVKTMCEGLRAEPKPLKKKPSQ
jgi:hypothetical protein